MSVPTNITDMSATAASNSPAGSDSIGTSLDDFLRAHAAFIRQLFDNGTFWGGTAGGTANALTLTPSPAITAYKAGQTFSFKAGSSVNSGATTVAISGLSTIAIQSKGAALVGGEIQPNLFYRITLDTTSTAQLQRIEAPPYGQIPFPATQSASSDANTLDDYEEGDWTPVLTFATPGDLNVVYSVQSGKYTKIGRVAVCQFRITTSTFTHTTASGNLQITGLPFSQLNATGADASGPLEGWSGITKASYTAMAASVVTNTNIITVTGCGSGQTAATLTKNDTPTGGTVLLRGHVVLMTA